jgi:Gluconate 2-dehydrogenase subunit 3
MDRRELLKMIAIVTGASVVGGEFLLSGCKSSNTKSIAEFSNDDILLLDEIGETIIPATGTPGAKAAKIGEFIKTIVNDCYTEKQQHVFMTGLDEFKKKCKSATGKKFEDCSPAEKHDFLVSEEKIANPFNATNEEADIKDRELSDEANKHIPWKDQKEFESRPAHYYTMIKQLTIWGFFTSKTGMTETLRNLPVPGKFDGNYAYNKGDKAWSE